MSGGRDGQSWVGMVEEVRTEFCNENKREKEKKII